MALKKHTPDRSSTRVFPRKSWKGCVGDDGGDGGCDRTWSTCGALREETTAQRLTTTSLVENQSKSILPKEKAIDSKKMRVQFVQRKSERERER